MFVIGVGSATPANRFTQAQCWDALLVSPVFPTLSGRSKAILKKVLLGDNGIDSRCLSFDRLDEAFTIDPDTLPLCVEICSAAFYLDEDPGVLISACLFGDAAGAMVCSSEASGTRPLRWLGWQTSLDPKNRDLLRFEQRHGMLRNVLDKSVPFLVVEQAREVLGRGLKVM